jgi:kinetochore protein NNF1
MNNTSPSPSPPPPTLSAPGPRATALLKLHADCTTHVLRTISYANFSACFPTPSREVPSAVRNLHEQFTQKLGDVLRREFEVILQDRNVVESLNGLDRLVEEGRRRKRMAEEEAAAGSGNGGNEGAGRQGSGIKRPIPPHTLPARQLYLSHLAPSLAMYAAQIEERQGVLSKANAGLAERVLQQRREIGALLAGLERVVRDLGGSVDALTGEGNGNDEEGEEEELDLEKVKEMVRGVEGDLRKRERERGTV